MIDANTFQSLRPYLFSVAYRMLGSAAEAEDVVQDTWLRTPSAPEDLASAKAWLTTVVTRLCLDHMKSARVRREEYVGHWLPEPVPTAAVDAADDPVVRRESVTMAFLVLLETLTPAERAAFLLREIFDRDYAEIASTLDTTVATARQLVHRARQRVADRRPRFDASPERQMSIVAAFMSALSTGDLDALRQHLVDDVAYSADGGGKAPVARQLDGADRVGRLLLGLWRKSALPTSDRTMETRLCSVNGEPAILAYADGALDTVFVFSTDDERITAIRAVRNPEKLAWIAAHTEYPQGDDHVR